VIGHPDAFRLVEPEMSDDEYEVYRVAWWKEFPCCCEFGCLCQGPPPGRPRKVRILVEFPDEPPRLPPDAARALLGIILRPQRSKEVRPMISASNRRLAGQP
jgi:hypothetical protein